MQMPLFVIPVLVSLVTQFAKRFFNKDWKGSVQVGGYSLPRYGGMPSAHTAFAFSLATVAWLTEGVASLGFAIAAAMVIFILDDALRMRIYLSNHGKALNRLIERLPAQEQAGFPTLEQRLGHSLPEVALGAVFGVLLSVILFWVVAAV